MRWLVALSLGLLLACGKDFSTPVAPDTAPPPVTEPEPPPVFAGSAPKRPLVGPLTQSNGVARDLTGPRAVIGYSDFPALRIFQDNPTEAAETFRKARSAGWQFVRAAYSLGETEDQDGGYWRGAHVHPYRTTQKVLIDWLKLAAANQIRAELFGAHAFQGGWPEERAFLEWMGREISSAGLCESVALFEWRNEYEITSPYRPRIEHGFDATAIFKAACPTVLVTVGAPGEDDGLIAASVSQTDVAAIDLNRGMPGSLLMKHAHTVYYHGRYFGLFRGRLLWATEPTGPGRDVYLPLDDPAFVYGLAATYVSTGQVFTYFNGPAVRHQRSIDSEWGFYELPKLLANIPEDIATWSGPSWFTQGNRFLIVLAEDWGQHTRPPRPIKSWEMVTISGLRIGGTGPISVPAGWKAGIFLGEWQ